MENYAIFGDFDQCISVTQIGQNANYNGKYCLVHIDMAKNVKDIFAENNLESSSNYSFKIADNWSRLSGLVHFVNGICVPSICSERDIEDLIRVCK